jgi:hypothetical protein
MVTFLTKIRAKKPILYLQVLAFLFLIAGYYILYGVINENQSVMQAFNNYLEKHFVTNTIGAFFTFGTLNYFGLLGEK